jgi:peptidoglycan/xylan/chitin deacetylase (PgdA/CDA1 family)
VRRVFAGAALAAAVLAALLAAGVAGPHPRPRPAAARSGAGAAAHGVVLGGVDVTGWTAADLRAYLDAAGTATVVRPVEAQVDPETRGVVPGLDGIRVDVDATLAAVLAAQPGTQVTPVLARVPAARSLADLPPAPVYRGNRGKQAVALLINVAWGEQFVPPLLDELRAARAPATFCLVGRWAEQHPELVRRMAEDGFDFCNHGFTDHDWAGIGETAAATSIRRADAAIQALTGRRPALFSPHKGEFDAAVLAAAAATGHTLVLWSRDTIDWQNPPLYRVLERTAGRARAGDIILMHPTAVTAQALPAMIRAIRGRGLRILSVSDLLSADPWAGTVR